MQYDESAPVVVSCIGVVHVSEPDRLVWVIVHLRHISDFPPALYESKGRGGKGLGTAVVSPNFCHACCSYFRPCAEPVLCHEGLGFRQGWRLWASEYLKNYGSKRRTPTPIQKRYLEGTFPHAACSERVVLAGTFLIGLQESSMGVYAWGFSFPAKPR